MQTSNLAESYATDQTLAPVDAALLLIAAPSLSLSTKITSILQKNVEGADYTWIDSEALFYVSLRLLALHTHNPSLLKGEVIARFAQRLLGHEQSVGGPYQDSHNMPATNAMIAQLFAALGKPLPGVIRYLEGHTVKTSPLWSLRWPRIILNTTSEMSPSFYEPLFSEHSDILQLCMTVPPSTSSLPKKTNSQVALSVKAGLEALSPTLRPSALKAWESVARADKRHEISMLTAYFCDSLVSSSHVSDDVIRVLGQANFYTWIAYTIYDDFIDNEGDPAYLSIANVAHRTAVRYYQQVAPHHKSDIEECFMAMDNANAWELKHCRYDISEDIIIITKIPSYKTGLVLAHRAGAHILGPLLACSHLASVTPHKKRILHDSLNHYLIARQLNDDLHDWREDLQSGHISFVVAHLLTRAGVSPGAHKLTDITAMLQEYFWQHGLEEICDLILEHTARAEALARQSKLFHESNPFHRMTTNRLSAAAQKSKLTLANQKEFLTTYHRD